MKQVVCSTLGCGKTYEYVSDETPCPVCGFSESFIDECGSNDPEILQKIREQILGKLTESEADKWKRYCMAVIDGVGQAESCDFERYWPLTDLEKCEIQSEVKKYDQLKSNVKRVS